MLQPTTAENFDVEAALNACLLEVSGCQRDASRGAEFVVTLIDFPQCRGEGDTIAAALQRARYEFGCLRDCRTAWQLDAVLAAVQAAKVAPFAAGNEGAVRKSAAGEFCQWNS